MARSLMKQFLQVEVNHAPRSENDKVDALAKLVVSLTPSDEREIQIIIEERHLLTSTLDYFVEVEEINVVSIFEVKEEVEWRQSLIKCI